MKRFIADLSFYLVMVYVLFSMFIPLFKEAVVKNGVTTHTRLSLCNGYMWAMVILFLVLAFLFQAKKMRGYASFLGLFAAIADGVGIYLFYDQQKFTQTAYSHSDSIISRFSSMSGVTKVTITQTAGIYFVAAAAILLAIVCIVNLAVKDDGN